MLSCLPDTYAIESSFACCPICQDALAYFSIPCNSNAVYVTIPFLEAIRHLWMYVKTFENSFHVINSEKRKLFVSQTLLPP